MYRTLLATCGPEELELFLDEIRSILFYYCYRSLFLFIALCLMLDPTGWCCGWLKIRELAHGFSASHSVNVPTETFCIKRKGVILFLFFLLTRDSLLTRFSDNLLVAQGRAKRRPGQRAGCPCGARRRHYLPVIIIPRPKNKWLPIPRGHTLQATCGTLPCNENNTPYSHLAEARCGTFTLPQMVTTQMLKCIFSSEKL